MAPSLKTTARALAASVLMLSCARTAGAQVLYDGSLGTRPDQQGWSYLTDPLLGASAIRSLGGGAVTLDSTPVQSDSAGWFAKLPPLPRHPLLPVLDRANGYTVHWTVRVDSESHASPHRAGLSVIVLSSDLLGVEIGHWGDEVWVQDDDPLFTHGEGALLDSGSMRRDYELCVVGGTYRLRVDGLPSLEGALRDYSSFGVPYDIPDFLFVGDDTSSAAARFDWERLEIELEPCHCRPVVADRDGDGVADCIDDCPDDPGKSRAGDCGCGVPDLDRDGDTSIDCEGLPGDLYPDGSGDGALSLADLLLAHRKLVTGSAPVNAWDLLVGDLSPDTPACLQPGALRRSCPAADGAFGLEDGAAIRALVAGRLELSCEPCSDPPGTDGPGSRRPGDLAPRDGGGDAEVDVGDVVQVLRWAVALDLPLDAEEALRADVAPTRDEGDIAVVAGDGSVDVADVLLILRATVQLEELRWPARTLHLDLAGASTGLAASVSVSGWPAWAVAAGADSPHCPPDGIGGLDAVAEEWSLTCVSEPLELGAPARFATIRYRAPEPVDPSSLSADGRLLDSALVERPLTVDLVAD